MVSEIIYQIYPRSFQDSNGDGLGDLDGIIKRLFYVADLGVTTICLAPIYPSPMIDSGYDIVDHCNIDQSFGDLATFDRLVKEAHRLKLKVVLELVVNHTSSEHPWFLASQVSREAPERDWYIWRDAGPDGGPPNNWVSAFGGPAWHYDEPTKQYYLHTFLTCQPDLNWRHPEVRQQIGAIGRFWLERGVNGFRADALPHILKDKNWRDDPINPLWRPGKNPYNRVRHTNSAGHRRLATALKQLRVAIGPLARDMPIMAEAYLKRAVLAHFCATASSKLDQVTNFNLSALHWQASAWRTYLALFNRGDFKPEHIGQILGNHDLPRLVSRYGLKKARLMALLQLSVPGIPVIYYGEELGLKTLSVSRLQAHDMVRYRIPGASRDGSRGPMPWTVEVGAGFSDQAPWLPLVNDWRRVNVATEQNDPSSFWSLYRQLIRTRRQEPALSGGRYQLRKAGNKAVLAFERVIEQERLLILANFSARPQVVDVAEANKREGVVLVSTHARSAEFTNGSKLKPYEGLIIRL
ncbi:MAG: alpha-amylase family glycosyl hydrolase [bacterium]|nr:alpha-amylase family glycosyl hydrolase [bacterium]